MRCPTCGAEAHESRFGAPCYACVPETPLFAAAAGHRIQNGIARMAEQMRAYGYAVEQTTVEFHRLSAVTGSLYPNRVPSKAMGRRGTRRAWKRAHPPGWFFRFFDKAALMNESPRCIGHSKPLKEDR